MQDSTLPRSLWRAPSKAIMNSPGKTEDNFTRTVPVALLAYLQKAPRFFGKEAVLFNKLPPSGVDGRLNIGEGHLGGRAPRGTRTLPHYSHLQLEVG